MSKHTYSLVLELQEDGESVQQISIPLEVSTVEKLAFGEGPYGALEYGGSETDE